MSDESTLQPMGLLRFGFVVKHGWACALAGVALAAAGAVEMRHMAGPGLRSAPAAAGPADRPASLHATAPVGELSVAPAEFTWDAVEHAVSYQVEIREQAGSRLCGGRTAEGKLKAPQEIQAALDAGHWLVWTVRAGDADGAVLAASGDVRFRVHLPEDVPAR